MKVRIAASAQDDLEQIGDYIARDNPKRALSFALELRGACMSLAQTPSTFPLLPQYRRFGIRCRVHGSYLILYRVDGDELTVVRVLHGARDYPALLLEYE